MMNHLKSRMRKSRDLGIPGPPGKGDGSRITNVAEFNKNFSEIIFSRAIEGFSKMGNKIVKKYK